MRIIRFEFQNNIRYGVIEEEKVFFIDGSIFDNNIKVQREASINLKDVRLLSPVLPSKVVCVGLNYKDHAKELGMALPHEPAIFLKPSTSVIGPGDNIVYPAGVERLDYEAELAVVIKSRIRKVAQDEVFPYILGYTCLNDITARDLQKKDIQWTRAKSFDTFCPIGPCITTDINPHNLTIELEVNGNKRQSSSTDNLIFGAYYLVSYISNIMTLLPGDIISTGTPKGIGPIFRGDEVEVKISSIGTLKNKVV